MSVWMTDVTSGLERSGHIGCSVCVMTWRATITEHWKKSPGLARGEDKQLVSKFCQDVTLSNPHTTELATREDETPTQEWRALVLKNVWSQCSCRQSREGVQQTVPHRTSSHTGIRSFSPTLRRKEQFCTWKPRLSQPRPGPA